MYTFCDDKKSQAINDRNSLWEFNNEIPSWVDLKTVDLDQFFTKPEIAEYCHSSLLSKMKEYGAQEEHYKFIEPSAGAGAFYNLLPKNRRIGIDLMPLIPDVVKHDFLNWKIKPNGFNYAVIGNPPFGYRAWLALAFVNHAAKFSEYVGMILPMSFQSDGKGSPKHRVKGLELIHSEILPKDSFVDPHGKQMKINAIWQIWKKGENRKIKEKSCSQWLELFTVDERKERLCGQTRLHEASFFLQRTFYHEPPSLVKSFKDVKYVCGYGLVFKKDKDKIVKLLQNADWNLYSNLAAHNCRHISMYHINRVLTEAGYINDR
jgi:hypothetical protein